MSVPPDDATRGFSRRSFLKGASVAAVATGGAAGAAGANRTVGADEPKRFGPGEHEVELRINGTPTKLTVETRTTLLDAIRERAGLTGAKKVCDRGACGACTVLVDGEVTKSCMLLAMDAVGSDITTVEQLSADGTVHPLVRNFVACDALQCGFCTPGMVMASYACLRRNAAPTVEQMRRDLSGNVCRCGTYGRVFEAIQRTAQGGGK